jgi:ketosteroid isomerase-like protein
MALLRFPLTASEARSMSSEDNKKTVEKLWLALSQMDWETLKSCLHPEVHYQDVPTEDPGAHGPENVVKRLRIAFDHLSKQEQVLHHIAADGDVVFLDHTETWTFKTGEQVAHTFATLHEMKDGKVSRWSDYWDVQKFVGQFPPWFLEEMARSSAADFSDTP